MSARVPEGVAALSPHGCMQCGGWRRGASLSISLRPCGIRMAALSPHCCRQGPQVLEGVAAGEAVQVHQVRAVVLRARAEEGPRHVLDHEPAQPVLHHSPLEDIQLAVAFCSDALEQVVGPELFAF